MQTLANVFLPFRIYHTEKTRRACRSLLCSCVCVNCGASIDLPTRGSAHALIPFMRAVGGVRGGLPGSNDAAGFQQKIKETILIVIKQPLKKKKATEKPKKSHSLRNMNTIEDSTTLT